jgi:FMN phosphatase YigB (HAD superfamily)
MSLVLDIDGVLIRDPLLLEHVRYNVVQYVRAKLPHAKQPDRVNRLLYTHYGHTARGLQQAFHVDTRDFNEKVYTPRLNDHLWEVLSGAQFQEEAEIIHEISRNGWEVTLFSNAPLQWSLPVMQAIGHNVQVRHDHLHLKPHISAYTTGFSNTKHHLYIDDSLDNLRAVVDLKNWSPVHFNDEKINPKPEFPTVGSVWEIGLMCASYKNISK